MEKILSGFQIINTGFNLPAPLAAQRLTLLGANVIKVEPPGGDPLKTYCPAWYQDLSRDQKVIRLDLTSGSGKSGMHDLLEKSDLLITSSRPSTLERLGLDWERLHTGFPTLCMVSIVGCPTPEEEIPGHDLNYQAKAGLVEPPNMPRFLLADFMGAERAVQATLGLLLARAGNGQGRMAQVPLFSGVEDLAHTLDYDLMSPGWLVTGGEARYNLYQTRSGWVALGALEPNFWQALIKALDLSSEPDKATLSEIFLTRTAEEWEAWAEDLGLPLCKVVDRVE